jgi:hypothetical protein
MHSRSGAQQRRLSAVRRASDREPVRERCRTLRGLPARSAHPSRPSARPAQRVRDAAQVLSKLTTWPNEGETKTVQLRCSVPFRPYGLPFVLSGLCRSLPR